VKERLVICNEEDSDGRARVTTDEAEQSRPEHLGNTMPIFNFSQGVT